MFSNIQNYVFNMTKILMLYFYFVNNLTTLSSRSKYFQVRLCFCS